MGQAQYGLSQMDQISPKSIAISQQAASSAAAAAAVQAAVAANSQIAAAVQQQVKVAEVSIPIKRPPHQRVSDWSFFGLVRFKLAHFGLVYFGFEI